VRRLAGAALALAFFVGACGGEDGAERTPAPDRARLAAQGRLIARPPSEAPERPSHTGRRPLNGGGALFYVPQTARDTDPPGLVVALHGAGGLARDTFDLLRPHADEANLMLLAPKSRGATWDVSMGGFGPDVAAIDRLLTLVFERYPIDGDRIAVAGFSDGASYALSLGLTNGDLFDAVIAFSPGFIAFAEARGLPRLFISHGTDDEILPIARTSRQGVPRLRAAGYRVRYREFDGGHDAPQPVVREAIEWLTD
jgi:phospholipase/carboxylesterase